MAATLFSFIALRRFLRRLFLGALVLAASSTSERLSAEAAFEAGEAVAAPGQSDVTLPLSIAADAGEAPIQAWSFVIRYDPEVLGAVSVETTREADLIILRRQDVFVEPGIVLFVAILGYPLARPEREVTELNDGVVARVRFCVLENAPPGEHAVEFLPEAVPHNGPPTYTTIYTAGFETRHPRLASGKVTVAGPAAAGASCPKDVHVFVPPEEPPSPPPGFILEGTFRLSDGTALLGETVRVAMGMRASWEVRSYSFSVDFDEEVLEALSIDEVFRRDDGKRFDFSLYNFNNEDISPGNAGVDEGFLVGAAVFSFSDNSIFVPRDEDVAMLDFDFRVRPEAAPGRTRIEFVDGARFNAGSPETANVMTIDSRSVTPSDTGAFVFIPGLLEILPDIQVFVRADANGDAAIDLSDAQTTLNFLFIGLGRPACYDAADANDDGELNVSDPIFTLEFLFLGGPAPPAPHPQEGRDETADGMGCLVRFET